MKAFTATLALLLVVPVFASAQKGEEHQYHGQGYLFVAGAISRAHIELAGSSSNSLQFGGGGEWLAGHGLGVGGELLNSTQSGGGATLHTWIGSINMSYHFGSSRKNRQVEPFVDWGLHLLLRVQHRIPPRKWR